MNQSFYRAFEDKFRGSRDLIRSRLEIYRPFVDAAKAATTSSRALDLGCGRGEWLEFIATAGFVAEGVDLDEGMLEACKAKQLNAVRGDAISHLLRQPDESASVISAFHLVEHIPFDQLQQLVREALRVLQPGGLLIMETPNPENLQVGAHTFYFDPTHQRPIPPLLLAFVAEYHGYHRSKIIRLQEAADLRFNVQPSLLNVIEGSSPDYAVVAQKMASPDQLTAFGSLFNNDLGLTLQTLAQRYDAHRERQLQRAEHAAAQAMSMAEKSLAIASHGTAEQTAKFEEALAHYHHLTLQQELRIAALLNSSSWRITAPLRAIGSLFRKFSSVTVRPLLLKAMRFVLDRPALRDRLSAVLKRTPGLAHRLHLLAIHRGLVKPPAVPVSAQDNQITIDTLTPDIPMSPHAHRIREDLQHAIDNQGSRSEKK